MPGESLPYTDFYTWVGHFDLGLSQSSWENISEIVWIIDPTKFIPLELYLPRVCLHAYANLSCIFLCLYQAFVIINVWLS